MNLLIIISALVSPQHIDEGVKQAHLSVETPAIVERVGKRNHVRIGKRNHVRIEATESELERTGKRNHVRIGKRNHVRI